MLINLIIYLRMMIPIFVYLTLVVKVLTPLSSKLDVFSNVIYKRTFKIFAVNGTGVRSVFLNVKLKCMQKQSYYE